MRQVALDIETTGMEPSADRVIEIGCVEILERRITEHRYHQLLDPEHAISEGATRVHGMRLEDLAGKPHFPDIAEEFLNFVRGAQVVIHNAAFDVSFLEAELGRTELPGFEETCGEIIDSLERARSLHPGLRNNLDALCNRYQVDTSERKRHSALLDASLLAEVYLAMTGGQVSLLQGTRGAARAEYGNRLLSKPPGNLRVLQPSAAQLEADRRLRKGMRESAE